MQKKHYFIKILKLKRKDLILTIVDNISKEKAKVDVFGFFPNNEIIDYRYRRHLLLQNLHPLHHRHQKR